MAAIRNLLFETSNSTSSSPTVIKNIGRGSYLVSVSVKIIPEQTFALYKIRLLENKNVTYVNGSPAVRYSNGLASLHHQQQELYLPTEHSNNDDVIVIEKRFSDLIAFRESLVSEKQALGSKVKLPPLPPKLIHFLQDSLSPDVIVQRQEGIREFLQQLLNSADPHIRDLTFLFLAPEEKSVQKAATFTNVDVSHLSDESLVHPTVNHNRIKSDGFQTGLNEQQQQQQPIGTSGDYPRADARSGSLASSYTTYSNNSFHSSTNRVPYAPMTQRRPFCFGFCSSCGLD